MPDVARRVLGDPQKKTAREWRYGRKGSLVVHIEGEHPGTWHDFESDTGGGVLDLVQRERRCDQAAALAWLTGEGLLDGAAPRPLQNRHAAPATARRTPGPVNGHEAARRAIAERLWAAAAPADRTPARTYLAGRWVWPPDGIGPSLPASVRWLPRGTAGRDVAANWYDVPEHTAGAIVYAFRQPGGATIRAVGLDALDGGGRQPGKRWRRTFGQKKGAAFAVGAAGGGPLVIVEGEADALASVWLHPGAEVWAAGGGGAPALAPAILEKRRRVVIEADPDGPGRDAALKLDAALGGRAEISYNRGGDPADVWTETLGERAGIMEFDGGLPRHEAEQRAWALAIERR